MAKDERTAREAHELQMQMFDAEGVEREHPDHEYAAELSDDAMGCRFCGQWIIWGVTNTGRKAPFDSEPPHRNHWITCPERAQAREVFGKRRRR